MKVYQRLQVYVQVRFTLKFFSVNFFIFLLKLFGAEIHWSSKIYPSVKIFEPWNLKIGKNSLIGSNVDYYNYDTNLGLFNEYRRKST